MCWSTNETVEAWLGFLELNADFDGVRVCQLLLDILHHPEIDLTIWAFSVFGSLRVDFNPRRMVIDILVLFGAEQYDIVEPLDAWHRWQSLEITYPLSQIIDILATQLTETLTFLHFVDEPKTSFDECRSVIDVAEMWWTDSDEVDHRLTVVREVGQSSPKNDASHRVTDETQRHFIFHGEYDIFDFNSQLLAHRLDTFLIGSLISYRSMHYQLRLRYLEIIHNFFHV